MRQLPLHYLLDADSFPTSETPDAGQDPLAQLVNLALTLERGGFSTLVFQNTNGPEFMRRGQAVVPYEPFTACGALAAATRRLGLSVAVPAATSQPYNVARRLASLDHISQGRVAWTVCDSVDGLAEQYGARDGLPLSASPDRTDEFVNVVRALWNSWSPNAIVVRPDGSRGVDGSNIRPINHKGAYYKVRGPLDIPRPPQGRPLVFQRIFSQTDLELAAVLADVVIPPTLSRADIVTFSKDLQALALAAGRDSTEIKIMPVLRPTITSTDNKTSLYQPRTSADKEPEWIGTSDTLCAAIEAWCLEGLVDGFSIVGPDIARFVDEITPALHSKGILDSASAPCMLRERLGFASAYGSRDALQQ